MDEGEGREDKLGGIRIQNTIATTINKLYVIRVIRDDVWHLARCNGGP